MQRQFGIMQGSIALIFGLNFEGDFSVSWLFDFSEPVVL